MTTLHSISELEQWCQQFSDLTIEKRGEGAAQFIYARAIDKAFELALDPAGYFLEGWGSGDPASDDGPEFSKTIGSTEELEKHIRTWLLT